jgi:hypothetical protein
MKPAAIRVIRKLKRYRRGLTAKDLRETCGVSNPADLILNIRKHGGQVDSKPEIVRNRYCESCRIVRYILVSEPPTAQENGARHRRTLPTR